MKLAAKLVLLFLGCLALVVGVFSFLSMQQAQELARAEHERTAADLAATLQSAMRNPHNSPPERQKEWIAWSERVNHVRIRLVDPRQTVDPELRPAVPAEFVVKATELTTFSRRDRSGKYTMFTYVPLDSPSGAQLEVAAPDAVSLDRLSDTLNRSAISLIVVSAVTSLVILFGGLWMVARPLDQLVEKVHRVGQGDLSGPVNLRRGDELGRLGEAVNDMCDQLKQQRSRIASETQQRLLAVEQLRHGDRLRTIGRLAAGLAHEIGTPLNVVLGRAELIASGKLSSGDVETSARTIKEQSQRITTIVQELLNFARSKTPMRAPVDLNRLLEESVKLLRPLAAKCGVAFQFQPCPHEAIAELDSAQMQQVFTNLLINAAHATKCDQAQAFDQEEISDQAHITEPAPIGTGRPRVKVSIHHVAASEIALPEASEHLSETAEYYWQIDVEDDGVGMEPDVIENIFEPFFTTKDVGEGTGLGLSIAYGIVREHAGWVRVESELGVGSRFSVYLPSSQATSVEQQATLGQ